MVGGEGLKPTTSQLLGHSFSELPAHISPQGVEPWKTVLETIVLPLNDREALEHRDYFTGITDGVKTFWENGFALLPVRLG